MRSFWKCLRSQADSRKSLSLDTWVLIAFEDRWRVDHGQAEPGDGDVLEP